MTNNPLISVIVPVYNVKHYLKKCLDSIINQSYNNLEIIIIDDGSTDGSGKIIDDYNNNDSRIKIVHQKNGGLSHARNVGLDMMQGEYVTFIDSDDFVTPDYVSYLFNLIKKTNFQAKLSLCSLMNHYSKTNKDVNSGNGIREILTGKECIEMMCYHNLVDTCAYAKLAKKELYNDIKFPEGKLFEDIATTYRLFLRCDQVACGFEPKYYYNVRSNSIVTSKFSKSKLQLLEMTDKMANTVNDIYPELSNATLRRRVYARFSTLNQTLNVKKAQNIQRDLINFIKEHKSTILNDPKTPQRDRIAYALLSLGLPFYKVGWKIYEKVKGVK